MVTQFSLLGLQTLHLGEQAGKLPSLHSPGPGGWAHSTWAKNQSEISRSLCGCWEGPADTQRTLALALLNCHLLTKVCGS